MGGEDWQALLGQASALRRAGRVAEAIAAYDRLLAVNPALPDSWYNLAWLQRQARRFEAALDAYGEALKRGVADPQEVHLNRAAILSDDLARPQEARAELEKALRIAPDYVSALLNLGNLAEDIGQRDEARSCYERALAAQPGLALALARLANVSEPDDAIIARLREALQRPDLSPADRTDLGYALARLLDLSGVYDEAFAAAAAANDASRESFGPGFRGYDPAASHAFIDRLIASFDRPAISCGEASGPRLIFVCGMFRSGSTLCEQILASHSQVAAGGELDLLPAIVHTLHPYPEAAASLTPEQVTRVRNAYLDGLAQRGLDAAVVTDKRPDNALHIGFIKTLFPRARIVHTRRAPLDNIVSLHFLQLSPDTPYALDIDHSAHWLAEQERLMAHWRALYPDDILELDYDALVAEPRTTIATLLEFCGLEWEEQVLDFHAAANPVRTASVWQVRQPLHGRSSGRWRNYARQLAPLAETFGERGWR